MVRAIQQGNMLASQGSVCCLTHLLQLGCPAFLEIWHLLEVWTRLFLKECHVQQNQLLEMQISGPYPDLLHQHILGENLQT